MHQFDPADPQDQNNPSHSPSALEQSQLSEPEIIEEDPPRKQKVILAFLSFVGVLMPGPQRFYLGQKISGWVYVVIGLFVFIPSFPLLFVIISYFLRVLCLAEGLWVITMNNQDFEQRFNPEQSQLQWSSSQAKPSSDPEQQLESMRRQGLITEAEYQERRQQLRKGF